MVHPPPQLRINFYPRHGESLARQRDEFIRPTHAVFQRRQQHCASGSSARSDPRFVTLALTRNMSALNRIEVLSFAENGERVDRARPQLVGQTQERF